MKITAVCGWAIPPSWFRGLVEDYFPKGEVRAVYPVRPADPEEAKELLGGDGDLYIGFSLGSLWLLRHRRFIPQKALKALLAPILSFTREDKMGGKTPAGELKYLIRALKNHRGDRAPLETFYSRCELPAAEILSRDMPDNPALIRGLEFLADARVAGESAQGFTAVLGGLDPFLDGRELKRHVPHLEIVKRAGHAPRGLLQRLANRMIL